MMKYQNLMGRWDEYHCNAEISRSPGRWQGRWVSRRAGGGILEHAAGQGRGVLDYMVLSLNMAAMSS
jgi:hypothetical protein